MGINRTLEQLPQTPIQRKISSLMPIEMSAGHPLTRNIIKEIVEPPLVRACEYLYDTNIQTISSSANQKDVESGIAYIDIDYGTLSEDNKGIAEENCELYEYQGVKIAKIKIPISAESTADDIEEMSLALVGKFQKQPMSWAPAFPGDEATAHELGLFFDPESGLMYEEEHYRKLMLLP